MKVAFSLFCPFLLLDISFPLPFLRLRVSRDFFSSVDGNLIIEHKGGKEEEEEEGLEEDDDDDFVKQPGEESQCTAKVLVDISRGIFHEFTIARSYYHARLYVKKSIALSLSSLLQ